MECIKWGKKEQNPIKMNLNVLSQLVTIFMIVSSGPAIVAYLAFKKAVWSYLLV